MVNSQLPNLIKQADCAVFMSRSEGGTNLMAMETSVWNNNDISSNTGHIDLLENNIQHAIGVKKLTRKVDPSLTKAWG